MKADDQDASEVRVSLTVILLNTAQKHPSETVMCSYAHNPVSRHGKKAFTKRCKRTATSQTASSQN